MPYLNWSELSREPEISEHAIFNRVISVYLTSSEVADLREHLIETLAEEGSELRVDLPRNWILFWKKRETETRLLLAHPQKDEWVATIALDEARGRALTEKLGQAVTGQMVSLREMGPVGSVSNLDLVISFR